MAKDNDDSGISQESDVRNFNFPLSKAENELFDEAAYKANKLLRIKRKFTKKSGESWEFWIDDEEVLTIKAARFKLNEREFFRTAEGIQFLLKAYKSGAKSAVKIKEQLDDYLSRSKAKK